MYNDENAVCGCDRTSERANKREEGRQTLKVIFQEWQQQVWQIPLQVVWDFVCFVAALSDSPENILLQQTSFRASNSNQYRLFWQIEKWILAAIPNLYKEILCFTTNESNRIAKFPLFAFNSTRNSYDFLNWRWKTTKALRINIPARIALDLQERNWGKK